MKLLNKRGKVENPSIDYFLHHEISASVLFPPSSLLPIFVGVRLSVAFGNLGR
ncbi:MAG TPA: hypothetical protein VK737_03305 [Opitutales bacterium]|nr:hypothetical protein [Opitutales bacterium]